MTSIQHIFRVVALFLLGFALLPLLIVHTKLASQIMVPLIVQHPEFHSAIMRETNHSAIILQQDATSTIQSTAMIQSQQTSDWVDGCHVLPTQSAQPATPPTGLVVVLALRPKERLVMEDSRQRICHTLPSQIEYFLIPQGLDMLFLIQEEAGSSWTIDQFVKCWKLEQSGAERTWQNLDGTTLTATPYHYVAAKSTTTIFLGKTILEYPQYIQEDKSVLSQPITPRSCQAPTEYIQATRWYTLELLHLGILPEYDYFLKIDTDILFVESIPFHLMQDMSNRNAIFGHTAEYHPKGSKTCAQGIQQAVLNFTEIMQARTAETSTSSTRFSSGLPTWKGSLCTISPETQRDTDQYYTNFIIGKVDFWQSPWVLEFASFLNEFPKGFFAYRWTDQVFWHYAMGLFLTNFQEFVADYSNLRCMPHPNCWLSSYNFQRYGLNAWHRCDNGGYFVHPKDFNIVGSKKKEPMRHLVWNVSQPLFQSTYQKDCSVK
jgi:hypothetical protein